VTVFPDIFLVSTDKIQNLFIALHIMIYIQHQQNCTYSYCKNARAQGYQVEHIVWIHSQYKKGIAFGVMWMGLN